MGRDYKSRSHSDDKEELTNTKSRSGPSGSKRSSSGYREPEVSERRHEARLREEERSSSRSRGEPERRQSKQWKNVATYLNVRCGDIKSCVIKSTDAFNKFLVFSDRIKKNGRKKQVTIQDLGEEQQVKGRVRLADNSAELSMNFK